MRFCLECNRLVPADTMRPVSRTKQGAPRRYACAECYKRIKGFQNRPPSRRGIAKLLLTLLALVFGLTAVEPAYAELSNDTIVGPGLRWRPAYDGSESQRLELVPIIRYLGQPLFIRSTQGVLEGGLRFEAAPGLRLGVQIAYEPGRDPGEADFLEHHRVPGLNPGASYGAQIEWDLGVGPFPLTLLARLRQHMESDRGAQADLRLSFGALRYGRFSAGFFGQATWANGKSTGAFYGITPQQAATSNLPAFTADSGWLFASGGVLWSFHLAEKWALVGNAELRRLLGDAADSPLTERKTNYYLNTGVVYRF